MSNTHRFSHPYLRFAGASAEPREDLNGRYVRVISVRSNQVLRLLPEEHELATLFDGKRTAAERLLAAQKLRADILASDMDAFAAELSENELLMAGSEEPLPVPPQTDAERRQAHITAHDSHEEAFPPLTEPGSMSSQSNLGPLAGSVWRGRVQGEPIDWLLHPARFAWLGAALAWPIRFSWGPWLLLALTLGLLTGLWGDQDMAKADFQRLLAWDNLLAVGLPMAILTNLIAAAARAWSIHRETGEWPRFGVVLALRVIPRFVCDTEGAAENVDKAARMRIIAAPLISGFGLFVVALLGWFIMRLETTMLPAALITAAMMGLGNALIRLNPLARTDGYYLLASWMGVADLREQSFLTLMGIRLRWGNRTPPPRGPLIVYALSALAFMIVVNALILLYPARWLEGEFGGVAVAVLLLATVIYVYSLARRYRDQRAHLTRAPWQPSIDGARVAVKRYGAGFAVAAVVALWPYTYEPGGRVTLQPVERGDVAAAIAGRVVSVAVAEGDWVEKGTVIALLDTAEVDAQIVSAEAQMASLQASLDRARNGATPEDIAQAEQRVATARARLRFSESEAQRAEAAVKRRAITTQERDAAISQADVDREVLALEQSNLTKVITPTREEDIREIEGRLASAEADLLRQRETRSRMELRAPVAGYVSGADLKYLPGRYLGPGDVVAVVQNTRELSAELRLPEFAAAEVQPGMAATVKVWSMPGNGVSGVVTEVAPVAEIGENGRVIRLQIRLSNASGDLYSEMSGQAKVEGRKMPLAVAYTKAIARFVMVEVWSWLP